MMPQLGETVTEGTITRWMKGVGDTVERDEPLFEVSTDKVDSEVPSPAAGVLTEILVPEGETVEVGVRLAVIGDGGVTASSGAPAATTAGTTAAPAEPAAPEPPAAPPPRTTTTTTTTTAAAATDGGPTPPPAPAAAASVAETDGGGDALLLSPMVRRLLAENGISETEVTGTGAGGRITRDDALRVVEARRVAQQPPPAQPARAAATTATAPPRALRPAGTPARATGSAGGQCADRSARLHGVVPGGRRPAGALLEHAPQDRRAHGAIEGHVAARLHRQRSRFRERGACAQRLG